MATETKKNNQDEAGIKLFGTRIMLENRQEKEEVEAKRKSDDDDEDQRDENNEKKAEKIIPCPRCKSMETKFCYFNNYNVNQPRHFCKGCQRYWTAGGALRNVPVGAGRRKAKPPCRGFGGLPEGCVFDSSGVVQPFELDGMVEEWHVVAATAAASQGGFRQILPVKRRRNCQESQTC